LSKVGKQVWSFLMRLLGKLLFLSLIVSPFLLVGEDVSRPNIVFILGDDQHWSDYGFMGSKEINTPHLDALAHRSLSFQRGYVAAPICRPSLASMATGLFPHQHGITGNDVYKNEDRAKRDIPFREAFHQKPSFIKELVKLGYLAHQSGKWWEGSYQDGGFTHGMTHGDPQRGGRHGDVGLKIGRNGLKPITDFVAHAQKEKKPFLLWYAPFLPHTPHNPPERLLKKYRKEGRPMDQAKYFAMCEWFDETCGNLLGFLDKQGMTDNTLIVFTCDNGWSTPSSNKDDPNQKLWRSYAQRTKGSPYEGGIRNPVLLSWPAKVKAENSPDLAHSVDLFPTIITAAGGKPPAGLPGIDLLDANTRSVRKAVYGVTHATHNMTLGHPNDTLQYVWCIRGNWKLIKRFRGKDVSQYKALHQWDQDPFHLYHLKNDPEEKEDLVQKHPEIVQEMNAQISQWLIDTKG
jgi:arylsulfatase A-like enzyme